MAACQTETREVTWDRGQHSQLQLVQCPTRYSAVCVLLFVMFFCFPCLSASLCPCLSPYYICMSLSVCHSLSFLLVVGYCGCRNYGLLCWDLRVWLLCCFTSTEAGWPIRDGDRVGRGQGDWLDRGNRPKKTGETVDRRQNNGSVKAVSPRHCPATCALCNCSFNCCAGQSH